MRRRYDVPDVVLERLAELGVLTPTSRGYDAYDVQVIEAIARFRAGGYDERLGFTVYDTLRYREALGPLVEEEVRALLDRLAGEVEVDRAAEIIASGAEPLRDLIGAMHSKLLLAELKRQRAARADRRRRSSCAVERGGGPPARHPEPLAPRGATPRSPAGSTAMIASRPSSSKPTSSHARAASVA